MSCITRRTIACIACEAESSSICVTYEVTLWLMFYSGCCRATCSRYRDGVSPMFPSPYVPQSLCSPLCDIIPYVSHVPQSLCYPEMFPSPVVPQTYITQSLCSPSTHVSHIPQSLCFPVPMYPSPCAPQVHLLPSPYRCSQVPMLPSPYVPPTNSPDYCTPKDKEEWGT